MTSTWSWGVGKKCGPRKYGQKVPKDELVGVIQQLRDLGLGCNVIGRLLGYSPSMIHLYQKEYMMVETRSKEEQERDRMQAIRRMLPEDLRATCDRILSNSMDAHKLVALTAEEKRKAKRRASNLAFKERQRQRKAEAARAGAELDNDSRIVEHCASAE